MPRLLDARFDDDHDFPWWGEEGGHPNGFFSHWHPLPSLPQSEDGR